MTEEDRCRQNEGHAPTDGDFLTIGGRSALRGKTSPQEKYRFISLSFWPFGARTPPRSRPPHPWRLAARWKRAALRPLTF